MYDENDYYDDYYDDENEPYDNDTLVAVLRGEYGSDAQDEALASLGYQTADENGLTQEDEAFGEEIVRQADLIERQLGRSLSDSEFKKLANDAAETGQVDLGESYNRLIGRDISKSDDRQAFMAEVFTEEEEKRKNEERESGLLDEDLESGPSHAPEMTTDEESE